MSSRSRTPRPALSLGLSLALHALLLGAGLLLSRGTPSGARANRVEGDSSPAVRVLLFDPPPGRSRTVKPGTEELSDGDLHQVRIEPLTPPKTSGAAPSVAAPSGGTRSGTAEARQGGFGSGQGPAFFAVGFRARSVVFLVDRSLSMGPGGALRRAREELAACLRGLKDVQFQVLFYNGGTESIGRRRRLLAATPDNLEAAIRQAENVVAEGSTDHERALREGLALQPDVIFLVTDGAELTPQQVQEIQRINRRKTVVNVIDLGPPRRDETPLRQLVALSGGVHVWR